MEKPNTNCHTTPDSSIPVDTDYSNRFSNSAQRCTLYPLVQFLRSHRRETRMLNLFLSSHVLTLTVISEGVRPPPCPNRTKHSPSLSSRCSPAFITLGFGPYEFRLSDCPYSLEWLYYSSSNYSSLLFVVTIHRSSDHPKFQLLIHHVVQST